MTGKTKKVCFAASSGGHFEQLMMLKPLMDKYNSFILTEYPGYRLSLHEKTYLLRQVNRKKYSFVFWMVFNTFVSLKVFLQEKPDAIVCTGVLACIPMCLICKIAGKKLIYIESFAKVTSPTKTGRFLYKYADRFYVQWPTMMECYPEAVFVGGVY